MQIGSGGNVLVNSPYAIAQTLLIMTLFAVFIMPAFVASVVIRDDETGFGPIVHSPRVSRFDHLFGRFTGAFLAGCLLFLSVPLGMMIGAAMPWLDPHTVGPFNLGHYLWVYLLLCVPTLFVTGAGFFAVATATRSMTWTYVGVIVFLGLYLVTTAYFARPEFAKTVALLAPFGRLCLFGGLPKGCGPVPLDTNAIHYGNFVVTGSTGGSVGDYRIALRLVRGGGWI